VILGGPTASSLCLLPVRERTFPHVEDIGAGVRLLVMERAKGRTSYGDDEDPFS